MQKKFIPKSATSPTTWAGGTTTELIIYPENSNYKKFDFDFRISTATVDIVSSIYTPLPNIKRTLMVLEGNLELDHQGQHKAILAPFDQDQFMGDWHTASEGKVVNFNLMTSLAVNGKVEAIHLQAQELKNEKTDSNTFVAYYVKSGRITLQIDNEEQVMEEKDFILLSDLAIDEHWNLAANATASIVKVTITSA